MINPMVKKLLKRTLPFLVSSLMMSGCWDRREINDIAFVLGTAIDRDKEGIKVSLLIPLPGNLGGNAGGGGGGGKSGGKPYTIKAVRGIEGLTTKLQLGMSRTLFFGHRRVLLIGEDAMKEGIIPLLDSVARVPENRLSTFIAVTKGKAADYLIANEKLERFPVEQMRELLQSNATIRTSVKEVISDINKVGTEALFPYLELKKSTAVGEKSEEIQAIGFVLTRDGKQVGVVQGEEAYGMRLLKGKFKPFAVLLKTDRGDLSFEISKAASRIKPYVKGNDIHFDLKLNLDINILGTEAESDIIKDLPKIQKQVEQKMSMDTQQLLEILKSKQSDVIGFGQQLNRAFPQKWESDWKPQWPALLSKCNFHVSVTANISRVGMIRANLATKEE
jgi:Ger(x)C family germination protein